MKEYTWEQSRNTSHAANHLILVVLIWITLQTCISSIIIIHYHSTIKCLPQLLYSEFKFSPQNGLSWFYWKWSQGPGFGISHTCIWTLVCHSLAMCIHTCIWTLVYHSPMMCIHTCIWTLVYHSPTMWPWVCSLSSLCLCFLIWKKGIVTVLPSQG